MLAFSLPLFFMSVPPKEHVTTLAHTLGLPAVGSVHSPLRRPFLSLLIILHLDRTMDAFDLS